MPSAPFPIAGTIRNVIAGVGADGIVGVKSGFTSNAGGCLVLAADRTIDGRAVQVLVAVLAQPVAPPPPTPHQRRRRRRTAASSTTTTSTSTTTTTTTTTTTLATSPRGVDVDAGGHAGLGRAGGHPADVVRLPVRGTGRARPS